MSSSSLVAFDVIKLNDNTFAISHVEPYFNKIKELKENEAWKEIILAGELALSNNPEISSKIATIHADLASTYFYLGEFQTGLLHSQICLDIGKQLKQPVVIVHGLYLLSAYLRAQASITANHKEKEVLFQAAREWVEQAFAYSIEEECPFIYAKALFNKGAAYADDPSGNLDIAKECYQNAMEIFLKLEQHDDYSRTAIRLGKIYLLKDEHKPLNELFVQLEKYPIRQKTLAQLFYLKSQYLLTKQDYKQAQSNLLQAIDIAKSLEMKIDLQRYTDLMNQIPTSL